MRNLLRDIRGDTKGVTLIEYALIGGLVSIVAIALLSAMGSTLKNLFSNVNSALTSA